MNIWLQITAGRGPAECQWVVTQLLEIVHAEAVAAGLLAELIDSAPGEKPSTLLSAMVAISGADAAVESLAESWVGSVKWIGKSPFRPHHKRQNWFVGVERLAVPAKPQWSERELEFSTLRASGPGGQHVNKTESAVRVVHRPTGISVVAREERSQQQNKRLALARLATIFAEREQKAEADSAQVRWEQHNSLERGNPKRTFSGPDFRPT